MANALPATVLLVDKDPILRRSTVAMLKDMGHREILSVDNGTDAWSMIKKTRLDLVISAWDLHEMTGQVLLKITRADASYAELAFVIIMDEVVRSQVVAMGEAGVTDILVRPFNQETFRRKIERALVQDVDPQFAVSRQLQIQGVEYMNQGRYPEALDSFKKILTVHESAEVYYNLGYIKTAQGRFEEAILAFRKATQINKTFAQAYEKMAEAYTLLGRDKEARDCYEKAGDIYLEKKMDHQAEETFMKVLAVTPNTPNIFNSLGIVYRRQGRYGDAIKMYQKALRVTPTDENIQFNLARVLLAEKRFHEAAEVLRSAVRQNPNFVEAVQMLKSIEMGEGLH